MTALFIASCSSKGANDETGQNVETLNKYTLSRALIGTIINLTALTGKPDSAAEAFEKSFDEVARIGSIMGPYGDLSEVARINKAQAGKEIILSNETFGIIAKAMEVSGDSVGGFDITFASAGKLWDFNKEPFVVPSKEKVSVALTDVGYQHLALDPEAVSMTKDRDGVKVGLGGIAKGYVIKRCVAIMKESGIKNGIVDAGGDVQVFGTNNGKPWVAAIRHPRGESFVATVPLADGESCATSGDYERKIITIDGKRYHHIIDPRTGYPTETFASVTVITPDPVEADAYATAFYVMGREKTEEFLKGHEEMEVVLIDLDLNIYASKSLKKRLTFAEGQTPQWF